jgi:hypothetical protein
VNPRRAVRFQGHAALSNCNASGIDCTQLASGSAVVEQGLAPGTLLPITIDFGIVGATIPPGRTLSMKVVVDGDSADHMMLAFGTAELPSALHLTST